MTTSTQYRSASNLHGIVTPSTETQYRSELNPPENITPSIGTVINAILIFTPLSLFVIGLYFGVINI